MGLVVLFLGLGIVITIGVFWGRYTIQKDTISPPVVAAVTK